MKTSRRVAMLVVATIALVSGVGGFLPRFDYARQDREQVNVAPSAEHWLGTDALGRDRFARLMHGTRLSLLLAPAAAALSMLLALAMGAASGLAGGLPERAAKASIDLVLSLPWLFLLLMVRAMLPLNTSPALSAVVTFMVLGMLGWAAPARILQAHASRLRQSQFMLLGRAAGIARTRLLWRQALPNLSPVLLAQFWISVPIFNSCRSQPQPAGARRSRAAALVGQLAARDGNGVEPGRRRSLPLCRPARVGDSGEQPANRRRPKEG